jgi:hypothetical protein
VSGDEPQVVRGLGYNFNLPRPGKNLRRVVKSRILIIGLSSISQDAEHVSAGCCFSLDELFGTAQRPRQKACPLMVPPVDTFGALGICLRPQKNAV